MHDADWAHLDLKPANLCMEISNGQTQTFLVDFGSSMHGLNTGTVCLFLPLCCAALLMSKVLCA